MVLVTVLAAVVMIARPVGAVEATLTLGAPFAFVDEPVGMSLQIEDPPRRLGRPQLPKVEGLTIEGPGSPSQRQTRNSGPSGTTTRYWREYAFRITPRTPGTYTIGPARVAPVGQPAVESKTVELRVLRRPQRDDIRFDVNVKPSQATVGSPVRVVYTAYYSRTLQQYGVELPILKLSQAKVEPVIVDPTAKPQKQQLNRSTWIYSETGFDSIGDEGYFTLSFGFEVTPMSTGSLTIPAATIQMELQTGRMVRRRGLLFNNNVAETRQYTARSKAVELRVAELPTRNRPPSFDGAIGRFQFEVAATPTEVPAYAPIELTMTIRGYGNIEKAPPPPLSRLPALQRDFEIATDIDGGQLNERQTEKTFRQVIRPRGAHVKEVPAIPFAYYNPERGDYETIHSRPIPITVEDIKTVGGADAIPSRRSASDGAPDTSRSPASLVEQVGVGANFRTIGTARHALDPRAEILSGPFLATLCLPPVALLLLAALRRRGRRDPALVRRRKALARAQSQLRGAELDAEGVSSIFQGYFQERLGLGEGELTPADLVAALNRRGVDGGVRDKASDLLERLLIGRFGGAGESPLALAHEAADLLNEVERCVQD